MRIFSMIIILFFCACQKEAELNISEDKMVAVIQDMLMAEIGITRVPSTEHDSLRNVYYNQIFTIHGIDSTTFHESLFVLSENPELSIRIYDKAKNALEHRKDSIQKKK